MKETIEALILELEEEINDPHISKKDKRFALRKDTEKTRSFQFSKDNEKIRFDKRVILGDLPGPSFV